MKPVIHSINVLCLKSISHLYFSLVIYLIDLFFNLSSKRVYFLSWNEFSKYFQIFNFSIYCHIYIYIHAHIEIYVYLYLYIYIQFYLKFEIVYVLNFHVFRNFTFVLSAFRMPITEAFYTKLISGFWHIHNASTLTAQPRTSM